MIENIINKNKKLLFNCYNNMEENKFKNILMEKKYIKIKF